MRCFDGVVNGVVFEVECLRHRADIVDDCEESDS